MFPKVRLDALTDGVFAVAMTLLVLDVRLPDDFHPADGGELLKALVNLLPKLLPYVLSFGVLGLRWIAGVGIRSRNEHFGRRYVTWWLLYLLLITFVPFSTTVVGRYAHMAPSIWLYSAHTMLIALIGMRMVMLTPELEHGDHLRRRLTSAAFLAVSSLVAVVLSFVDPNIALWGFALNFAQPVFERDGVAGRLEPAELPARLKAVLCRALMQGLR